MFMYNNGFFNMGILNKIHEDFFTLLRKIEAIKEQKERDNCRRIMHKIFYKTKLAPYHNEKI